MAQAYLWQQRFAPPIQTGNILFPKKVQFNPKCPNVNACALGAVTNVSTDASGIVSIASTYKMQGQDCFQFTVSNLLSNSSYTFRMKTTNTGRYPSGANQFGELCRISVSPIVNGYACSTSNVIYTSILPTPPYGVNLTLCNIQWNTPTVPENYGIPTITSYTVGVLENIKITPSSTVKTWSSVAMSSNGIYQVLTSISQGSPYIWTSSNYGSSLSLNGFRYPGSASNAFVAVNATGDTQFAIIRGNLYFSQNYGINWSGAWVQNTDVKPVSTSISIFSNVLTFRTYSEMIIGYDVLDVNSQRTSVYKSVVGAFFDNTTINSGTITDVGGLKATVVDEKGRIYVNVTGLDTWSNTLTITPQTSLTSVASSYDGRYRTAVAVNGSIWTTTDNSTTWSNLTNVGVALSSVKMTASGNYQIATGSNAIFHSENYGQTWTRYDVSGAINLSSAAMSSNGIYQTFIESQGNVWAPESSNDFIPITDPRLTISGQQFSISLLSYYRTSRAVVQASNMAGSGPFTKPV